MKKTYISPEVEIVRLQTMQMMATSVNAPVDNTPTSNDDALGRGDGYDW